MKIVFLNDYDIVNYKKPSMFIGFSKCSGKCNKIAGKIVCQNEQLRNSEKIDVSVQEIVNLYMDNPLINAIVCGGLEPFDTPEDLIELVNEFRLHTNDDIVIYTGYTEVEVKNTQTYKYLLQFPNIIIKFGRFIPETNQHFDEVLGVKLFGDNQYAKKIS